MKRVRGKPSGTIDLSDWTEQQVCFVTFLFGVALGLLLLAFR